MERPDSEMMSADNFFTRIYQWLKAGKQASKATTTNAHPVGMMGNLLDMVKNTDELEIGCDQVFEMLDQYVELEARGEDVAHLLPLVKRHLDKCRDCYEEYEALARAYEATSL